MAISNHIVKLIEPFLTNQDVNSMASSYSLSTLGLHLLEIEKEIQTQTSLNSDNLYSQLDFVDNIAAMVSKVTIEHAKESTNLNRIVDSIQLELDDLVYTMDELDSNAAELELVKSSEEFLKLYARLNQASTTVEGQPDLDVLRLSIMIHEIGISRLTQTWSSQTPKYRRSGNSNPRLPSLKRSGER